MEGCSLSHCSSKSFLMPRATFQPVALRLSVGRAVSFMMQSLPFVYVPGHGPSPQLGQVLVHLFAMRFGSPQVEAFVLAVVALAAVGASVGCGGAALEEVGDDGNDDGNEL